jgi:hypothetical protein
VSKRKNKKKIKINNMKKEVLEEINRFRELVSLKPMNIINESVPLIPPAVLKKVGLEAAENELESLIKLEAKKLGEKWYKEYLNSGVTLKNYRAGVQGAKEIPDESINKIIKQIETKTGKTVPSLEKAAFEREIKMAVVAEKKAAVDLLEQESKEIIKSVQKEVPNITQGNKKSTWQAIKEHIKRNKGKYALGAAALALAAYAYFYPGEKPEEDDDEEKEKPQRIKYRYCPDFPFTKSCKNEKIREIQKCIGTVPDGFYGPKTEQKLIENGYSTTITKEVFNKIMDDCGRLEVELKPDYETGDPDYETGDPDYEPTYYDVINN